MPTLPVKPELGPTLPELLARRTSRAVRVAIVVLAVLVVVLLAARVLRGSTAETPVVVKQPVAFNLRYGGTLKRVAPAGDQVLALAARRNGSLDQSFAVTPLHLPAYQGSVGGELPVYAERLKTQLARRFADFTLVQEGRARINELPGYELIFSAHNAQNRRIYGRWTMVLPDAPGAREGVTMQLLARWSPRVPNSQAIGNQGQLKLPLRSFRFGIEAP